MLIFSKLKSGTWPKMEIVAEQCLSVFMDEQGAKEVSFGFGNGCNSSMNTLQGNVSFKGGDLRKPRAKSANLTKGVRSMSQIGSVDDKYIMSQRLFVE